MAAGVFPFFPALQTHTWSKLGFCFVCCDVLVMKDITISKSHRKTHYAADEHAASVLDQSRIVSFNVKGFHSNFPNIYSTWLVGLSANICEWTPPILWTSKWRKKKLLFFLNLRILRKRDERHAADTQGEAETLHRSALSFLWDADMDWGNQDYIINQPLETNVCWLKHPQPGENNQ